MSSHALGVRSAEGSRARTIRIAWICAAAAAAVALRLHGIARPADYDEGVYWQSLRSMAAGYVLYRDIYYSQPPLFLAFAYPFFAALGHSLVAARIAMVLASLAGLYGIFALGGVLAGRAGALAALTLLILNAPYLSQSQTLHAEIPAAALAIAGVAWSFHPGRANAASSGACIAAAILCKLLVVAAVVPFAVLFVMRRRSRAEALFFLCAFAATLAVAAAVFAPELRPLAQQVFGYHAIAEHAYRLEAASHVRFIGGALKTPLLAAAAAGGVVAVIRRDAHAVALAAWFVATAVSLYFVTPLWDHHLLVLFPPLIALSVLALVPAPSKRISMIANIAIAAMALTVLTSIMQIAAYYRQSALLANAVFPKHEAAAADLASNLAPGDLVVTDLPGVVAQAQRNTPAWLVDTSEVRIRTGEITADTLIASASQPNVRAVLYGSRRFTMPQLRTFLQWLPAHYHLAVRYGPGQALWLKPGESMPRP